METTFSYMENIGILHPQFRVMTSLPFRRMASFRTIPRIIFEAVPCVMVHERPVFGGDPELPREPVFGQPARPVIRPCRVSPS
jgi:hypothetical protein